MQAVYTPEPKTRFAQRSGLRHFRLAVAGHCCISHFWFARPQADSVCYSVHTKYRRSSQFSSLSSS